MGTQLIYLRGARIWTARGWVGLGWSGVAYRDATPPLPKEKKKSFAKSLTNLSNLKKQGGPAPRNGGRRQRAGIGGAGGGASDELWFAAMQGAIHAIPPYLTASKQAKQAAHKCTHAALHCRRQLDAVAITGYLPTTSPPSPSSYSAHYMPSPDDRG